MDGEVDKYKMKKREIFEAWSLASGRLFHSPLSI
jgi:hypothetical protein